MRAPIVTLTLLQRPLHLLPIEALAVVVAPDAPDTPLAPHAAHPGLARRNGFDEADPPLRLVYRMPDDYRQQDGEALVAGCYAGMLATFAASERGSLGLPALTAVPHAPPPAVSARLAAWACNDFLARVHRSLHLYIVLDERDGPAFAAAFIRHFSPPAGQARVALQLQGLETAGWMRPASLPALG